MDEPFVRLGDSGRLGARFVATAPARSSEDVFYAHLVRCRIESRAPEMQPPLDVRTSRLDVASWCADAALACARSGGRRAWRIAGVEESAPAPIGAATHAKEVAAALAAAFVPTDGPTGDWARFAPAAGSAVLTEMWSRALTREVLALDTEQRRGPAGALLASALVRFG